VHEPTESERKIVAALEAKLAHKARQRAKLPEGEQWRGEGALLWMKDLVRELAQTAFGRQGLSAAEEQALRGALHMAAGEGLLVHGAPHHNFVGLSFGDLFTLTPRGMRYYSAERLSLVSDNDLVDALRALESRRSTAVDAGTIVLLDEAYRCWSQGCYRAATVLIGVASEDSLGNMLDALEAYPAKDPAPGPSRDWSALAGAKNIAGRFSAGLTLLKRLEKSLRKIANGAASKPTWADVWFRNIDSLASIGEAVRYARNKAAHDGEARFRRSDVGLILASMPTLLEQVDEVRAFLVDVPGALGSGVSPPAV
jgi:hypothetical protein